MNEIAGALMGCERIMIVSHVAPDGDTLGSSLAIRRALAQLGKQAIVVCQDPAPRMYSFLPDIHQVVTPDRVPFEPDCVLFVDVAAPDRAGSVHDISVDVGCRLLLDHHGTTHGFSGLAVIDPNASSTGELALELLDALGVPLDADLSLLLYVAIATDTGNFGYSYTTPAALRAVARCIEAGLQVDEASRRLFRLRTVPRTRLIGVGLSNMERMEGGRIALMKLTLEDIRACEAQPEDTEGLVNYLIEMESVEVCFLAVEQELGTKISLRSSGGVNVAKIAQGMGGGGHMCAAGVTLGMRIEAASLWVLDALRRALRTE